MKTKSKVIILLIIVLLIAVVPLFALKGAEFGGSDDAGSVAISKITGTEYKPWFTPVLETAIGGELPGEIESLLFCVQTGIGVGILAFFMGRLVERTKHEKEQNNNKKTQ
ncbi:energy-coupling factor ABC transporter substrate-binding protein [Aminipila terrae]